MGCHNNFSHVSLTKKGEGEEGEREREQAVSLPTRSGCDVQWPISESGQKLIMKSLRSFSRLFHKSFNKRDCHGKRQFEKVFPACCGCSEQQTAVTLVRSRGRWSVH